MSQRVHRWRVEDGEHFKCKVTDELCTIGILHIPKTTHQAASVVAATQTALYGAGAPGLRPHVPVDWAADAVAQASMPMIMRRRDDIVQLEKQRLSQT